MTVTTSLRIGRRTCWIVALAAGALWCLWAIDSAMRDTAPGLLDDGAHIAIAQRYIGGRFFTVARSHIVDVFNPAVKSRFYEVQAALLGAYANAFGLDLRFWYLSNFALCFLTALAAAYIAASLTKDRIAGLIAFVGVPPLRRLTAFGAMMLLKAIHPVSGARDYTCGYRAYRVSLLRAATRRFGDGLIANPGFACMVELLLKLNVLRPKIAEIPLRLRYDLKPTASKMEVGSHIRRLLKLMLVWRIWGFDAG
jgi:hypothetical protein